MPTNLYGPGDNYHPENSQRITALIRRFYDAKQLGTKSVVCGEADHLCVNSYTWTIWPKLVYLH